MNRYYLLLRSFVVCLCIVAGHALQAQVIYVTPNGAGDQSGSNWANAAPGSQLQNKMDAAWDGSEIWVSKGTYYPTSYPANSVFTGSYSPSARNYSFYLKSGVTMYGGFAGGETNLGLRNLLYNPTVLSGDIGVAGNSADNCFHVVVSLGGNNATALDGFIIRDGNANLNSFGSHTVSGATVSSDIAPGILLINSAAKFRNCEISNTSSLSFGAVYNNDYSSTVFTNCIFLDNSAGIGTISNSGTISLINCLLFGNTTQYTAVNYGNASFTNCNIIYNTGTGFVNFTGSATLSNCVIWGNTRSFDAPAVINASYCLIQGGYTGAGNLNADPLFVYPNDPNGPDDILRTADDGLRLGVGSPAINAGSNALLDPHTGNDITGARRVQENIVDMGAYEAGACPAVTILYVDGSKAASGNGLSWSSAFKTLQEALNFTETCNVPKQIWVKKGIYYPTAYPEGCTNCSEPRTRSFRLKNNTAIYGGFAGGETNLNQRNIALNLTILSGNLGSSGNNTDNAYHVITSYYNDSTSKLDGFIIEGGYTPIPSGLFADFSNINYNNNSFEITHADGGGAYLFNSAALFSRCTFMNNQAGRFGGGVYSKSSQAKFTGCAFSFNRAEGKDGGGIYQDNCTSEIINCIFSNNTASRWGGALGLYNSPSIIVNNDFIYNLASQGSGALNKYGSGPAVIRNCIFLKNGITYYKEGPQVAPMEPPIPEIIMTNSLMHDDPLFFSFVDPNDPNGPDNTFGTADDGLRLSCSSPAINKGDNSAVSSITTDITGNSRIQYSTVDMGAYESSFTTPFTVSVFLNVFPNNVCAGTPVSFMATAIYGGSNPVYEWRRNGIIVPVNNDTYTSISFSNNDTITVQLRSSLNCVYSPTASDTAVAIIRPKSTPTSFSVTACGSYTLPWGDVVTNSNTYIHGYQNVYGCDSVVTVYVTIKHPSTPTSFSATACSNYELPWGQVVTASGAYTHTYSNVYGCDSAVTAHVTINYPGEPTSFNATACGSYTLPWEQVVTASGNYVHTYTNYKGCDSVVTAHITINHASEPTSFSATACGSYTLPWGQVVTQSGDYTNTYTNVNGCDSVVTAHIVINHASGLTVLDATGCSSYALPWGQVVTQSGLYVNYSYQNVNGCDSFVLIFVTINYPSEPTSFSATACGSYTLPWGGVATSSNAYTHTYQNVKGCDSVVTAHITINYPGEPTSFNATACGSYTLPWGDVATSSNAYTHTYQNVNGCDSVVTAHITINYPSEPTSFNATACGSYALPWGTTVTASGDYTHTYSNISGCDSVVTAHITINHSSEPTSFNATACGSYALPWETTVTASGDYTHTYSNISGCDSVVTAHITINYPSEPTSFNATACGHYALPWETTVTASGDYTHTYSNISGCDSVVTAHITINYPSEPTSFNATECGSYRLPWGQIVTQSGDYTNTYTNVNGCDSAVTAHITINYASTPTSFNATACSSYTLPWGTTVTIGGNYVHVYRNAKDCDSVVTVHVTINYPSAPTSFNAMACSSYVLPWETTVTVSGNYTHTYPNINGCDSVVTAHVIINYPSEPTSFNATACSSYTLPWGTTVTISGNYVHVYRNAKDCDSVVTAHITINYPSTPTSFSATACGSYTLPWGPTVTASNNYVHIYTNTKGCDSVVTAHITIYAVPGKPVISYTGATTFYAGGSITLSAPAGYASYLWSNNAATSSIPVTQSGNYTVKVTNNNSCSSLVSDAVQVTVLASPVSVSHLDGDNGQLTNNNIRPYLQLNNESNSAVAYKDITIRYWLTVEDFAPLTTNLVVDWAQLGTNKVKMKYVKLGQPCQGAYGYIEYSFDATTGNLAGGSNSGPIQSRAGKNDWTNFNEADDHSYVRNTSYTKNNKITVYKNGVRVWGTEPALITPVQSLKMYSQDKSSGATTNSISNWVKLNNEGNTPVSYKDITVRYWFTADGNKPLNYYLDYAQMGSSNIKWKFVKLSPVFPAADTYLEIGFTAADSLYPISTTGNIQHRIAKNDWSNFNQLNDHSYKAGQAAFTENIKMTVYVKGVLVYGQEPTGAAVRQSNQEVVTGEKESLSSKEEISGLTVKALNNPVTGNEATFIVKAAPGERVQVILADVSGKVIGKMEFIQSSPEERKSISFRNTVQGMLFLKVNTQKETKTIQLLASVGNYGH